MLPPSSLARLHRLHRWLAYELATPVLFLLHYVVPFPLTLAAVVVCAGALTPFMLWTLYGEGRRGWLLAFAAVVGLPVVVLALVWGTPTARWLAGGAALVGFLTYCFVLRLAVREWMEEAMWKRALG